MLKFKDKNIDFKFVCQAVQFDNEKRKEFFDYLENNRSSIKDESILGVLDYLKINNGDFSKLKLKLDKVEVSNYSSKVSKQPVYMLLMLVASFAVLVVFTINYLDFKNTTSNQVIFEPREIGASNMLNTNEKSIAWRKFAQAYNKEDFETAFDIINQMPKKTSQDSLNYFKGIISYKLQDFKDSSMFFKQVTSLENSVFYQDSQYFLALCYYKSKEFKKSTNILKKISSESNHPYKFEALNLISQLSDN